MPKIIYTKEQIAQGAIDLALKIMAFFGGNNFRNVIFIVLLKGGRVPAQKVFDAINAMGGGLKRHRIIYLNAQSYNGTVKSGWKIKFSFNSKFDRQRLEGKTIIVIDDLYDTGETIMETRVFLHQFMPGYICIATFFSKNKKRKKGIKAPQFPGLPVPDEWLVGIGLDHFGVGRKFITNLQSLTKDEIDLCKTKKGQKEVLKRIRLLLN